ncbi:MAG: MBL fold metallo-hydrolase [Clostridia bacterium]|nr:MBL fold metallo-hydrolase [Clostridia bacterium]
MNSRMQEVRNAVVPSGAAILWWLGQMGMLVKIGETILCIDYFASPNEGRCTPPPVPAEEVCGVTAFLGTHNHLDHIDHEAWKTWARTCPDALFVFPRMHREEVLADGIGSDRAVGLNDGESVRIGDVTVHAMAAAHEFLSQDPESHLYPCLQYIIVGNGVCIHHAGDTLRYEGMLPRLAAFGRMDTQLLPINGRDGTRYRRQCIGNMTWQEAVDFAGEAETRLVIPGHWDMFADNSADPQAFADYLDAKYHGKIACRIPKVMDSILITHP